MGKVKDGSPAAKSAKVVKGGSAGDSKRRFAPVLANLTQTSLYKPLQGKQARLWTAVGLGLIILFGLRELFESLKDRTSTAGAFGIPAAIGAAFGLVDLPAAPVSAVRRVPDRRPKPR